ncbi:box C/D snoRNA protein 1 [Galendromus occidentalis]|uniref:Box C/D snoRNA protein 1 n=1 Tax=Galendromus occidentalis TaxID=34638 RepID=A0AAJ6QUV8_9ACAR|nr:box C/D snoRNA protein 1 [Galendromus occidentalis]
MQLPELPTSAQMKSIDSTLEIESTKSAATMVAPQCSICQKSAKYRCPRCALRTCSVDCVRSHKEASGCSGLRDRTAYVPLSKFTEMDLQSDYRLLEETANVIDGSIRDKIVKPHRGPVLPQNLINLQKLAWKSSRIGLQFLPEMFSKRKMNRTSIKRGILHWTVAVEIPQSDVSLLKHNVASTALLKDFLHDVIRGLTDSEKQRACALVNCSFNDLSVFLKAERRPANDERYHQLDSDLSLEENFKEKHITEFPTLWLATQDHRGIFNLLESVKTKYTVEAKLPSFFQEVDDSD